MSDINITQAHNLDPAQARAAAEQVAQRIAKEFDLACHWQGDTLKFGRSGVEGTLTLADSAAHMNIKLGFLMGAFKSAIEGKVTEKMRAVFAAA
ncbi:polyhydroxyalkanoic acid system family protein [Massilia sp. SR12]